MKTAFAIVCAVELATGAWFTAFLCFTALVCMVTNDIFDERDRQDEADRQAKLARLEAEYQARAGRIPSALRTR